MAKRTRGRAQSAWWTGIAALGALALYAGTWRLWALTLLVWSMYELCFCPTRCGVATREGDPCRNGARGRLYACTNVAGHQQLKTDALWHLPGRHGSPARLRPRYGQGAPSHRKTTSPPSSEQGHVEPNQRIMAYVAVVCVLAVVIPAVVGLAAF